MIEVKNLPPPDDLQPVRRALISVFDKSGVLDFAKRLSALDIELISTGGTARMLTEAGLDVTEAASLTGFPEILGGRVKTLHPSVHGAILARRNDPDDLADLDRHEITPIDLVVTNLYPFEKAVASADVNDAIAAENIDIGGPTMIRAAAKNFFFVGVVTSPSDYDGVASELELNGGTLSLETRRRLATSAFRLTVAYDGAIEAYLSADAHTDDRMAETFRVSAPRAQELRYGENPHQSAALYGNPSAVYEQLHGKELSYNNLLDLGAAINLIAEFDESGPSCAILKHTNPCGVGTADSLEQAYRRAFSTDRQSPFGGIVVVNRPLDAAAASAIDEIFTEIVIAPEFDADALDLLKQKKNRRLIRLKTTRAASGLDVRTVAGALLVQHQDASLPDAAALRASSRVVTERQPTDDEWRDLDFAWRVVKHVKSNAIVYARGGATLGIGAGQMSRIDSSEIAVMKAGKSDLSLDGSVVASDAFFPFADGLLAAAGAGARAVIQPGGSIRDDEVIAAANEHGLAMVFTGKRHFRH